MEIAAGRPRSRPVSRAARWSCPLGDLHRGRRAPISVFTQPGCARVHLDRCTLQFVGDDWTEGVQGRLRPARRKLEALHGINGRIRVGVKRERAQDARQIGQFAPAGDLRISGRSVLREPQQAAKKFVSECLAKDFGSSQSTSCLTPPFSISTSSLQDPRVVHQDIELAVSPLEMPGNRSMILQDGRRRTERTPLSRRLRAKLDSRPTACLVSAADDDGDRPSPRAVSSPIPLFAPVMNATLSCVATDLLLFLRGFRYCSKHAGPRP